MNEFFNISLLVILEWMNEKKLLKQIRLPKTLNINSCLSKVFFYHSVFSLVRRIKRNNNKKKYVDDDDIVCVCVCMGPNKKGWFDWLPLLSLYTNIAFSFFFVPGSLSTVFFFVVYFNNFKGKKFIVIVLVWLICLTRECGWIKWNNELLEKNKCHYFDNLKLENKLQINDETFE